MVENLPANAGDTGSSPGLGRSHMPRSNWAREPQLLSLRVWSLCSATREAAIVRGPHTVMKSGPRLPQLEKALPQKRRPNIAINQSINKSLKKKKKESIPRGDLTLCQALCKVLAIWNYYEWPYVVHAHCVHPTGDLIPPPPPEGA